MKIALRSLVLSLSVLFLSTLHAESAAAASTLTIGQMSRYDVIGSWILKMPNNQTLESTDPYVDASLHTIQNVNGTFTITFEPPQGAEMVVTVSNGTTKLSTTTAKATTFTVTDGDNIRVMAEYTFHGIIKVGSEPPGVRFRLTGTKGVDVTGTTPAEFSGLPPLQYSVYYSQREGCVTPKPQHRTLSEERALIFFMTYSCGHPEQPAEPRPELPPEREVPGAQTRRDSIPRVDVETIIAQTEVLPGGTMFLVLHVRNPSSKLLRDVSVRVAYDAANVMIVGQLPKDGRFADNMLLWTINDLQPRENWTVSVEMRVKDTALAGTKLDFTTTVESDSIVRSAGDIATIHVVTGMPQTGVAADLLFVLLTGSLTFGILRMQKKSTLAL